MGYEGLFAEVVRYPGANGDTIEGYYARPLGPGPHPGVVIFHHAPGWDQWTRQVAHKLALHGYAVISPNLYFREAPGASPDDAAAAARAVGGVPDARLLGDAAGSAKFLREQPYANGKVGIIGFCSGGRQVYLAACNMPEIDAAVDCWGGSVVQPADQLTPQRPVSPIEMTAKMACPILGIFGNDDTNPDPAQVNQIEAALKQHGKTYEFHRYDGAPHAFFCWDNPARYRPEQAADGWKQVLAFYEKYLQTPVADVALVR